MTAPVLAAESDLPSREEMWKMIQAQQKQIEALQAQATTQEQEITQTKATVVETQQKAEQATTVAETTKKEVEEKVTSVEQTVASIDPEQTATRKNGWWDKTSIGGYGELHYNGGNVDEVDFHRFVFNLNHDFNDDVRLRSEVEIEHALIGDGSPGDVVLEQALLEVDLTKDDAHKAQAGILLLPLGILNEVHEPTTFFGTERNICLLYTSPSPRDRG